MRQITAICSVKDLSFESFTARCRIMTSAHHVTFLISSGWMHTFHERSRVNGTLCGIVMLLPLPQASPGEPDEGASGING